MNFIGGIKPLINQIKPNDFKYTFNKERQIWIMNVYPFADTFINVVRDMPWNSYSYNGNCEFSNKGDDDDEYSGGSPENALINQIQSIGTPNYCFFGGTVYEILNRKYSNVSLYSYADPTGDVDCIVYIPQVPYNTAGNVYFLNTNGEVNEYYAHFTNWAFNNLVDQVRKYERFLDEMFPNMIDFNIDEYDDIPNEHKNKFGYNIVKIGKFFIVAFLTGNKGMFKIQLVCKLEDSSENLIDRKFDGYEQEPVSSGNNRISVIDHAVELIFPLPEEDIVFSPSDDSYNAGINTINVVSFGNSSNYPVQLYGQLVKDNFSAYIERIKPYKTIKSSNNLTELKEIMHKPLNHVSRLFYLYELFYKNPEIDISRQLVDIMINPLVIKKLGDNFIYYKIENNIFYEVLVSVKEFINAYIGLFMIKGSPTANKLGLRVIFSSIQQKYKGFLEISSDENIYVQRHDNFIKNLFGSNSNVGGFKTTKRKHKTTRRKHTIKKRKHSIKKRKHKTNKRKHKN